jgi:FAD-dependent urate hydroxylase
MPVDGGRFYFSFDVPQPSGLSYDRADGTKPLVDAFGRWAPGVRVPTQRSSRMPRSTASRFGTSTPSTRGPAGVAILGDATHNTSPDIGQGACSALEDSSALGISRAIHTISVEDSVKRYERMRIECVGELVLAGPKRGDETHGYDLAVTAAWHGSRGTHGVSSAASWATWRAAPSTSAPECCS